MSNSPVSDSHSNINATAAQFVNAKGGKPVDPSQLASLSLALISAQTTDLLDVINEQQIDLDSLDFDDLQEEIDLGDLDFEALQEEVDKALDSLPSAGKKKAKKLEESAHSLPREVKEKAEQLGKDLFGIMQKIKIRHHNKKDPTSPSAGSSTSVTLHNNNEALAQMAGWLSQLQQLLNQTNIEQSQMRTMMAQSMQSALQQQYINLENNIAEQNKHHHGIFHKIKQAVTVSLVSVICPPLAGVVATTMILKDTGNLSKLDTGLVKVLEKAGMDPEKAQHIGNVTKNVFQHTESVFHEVKHYSIDAAIIGATAVFAPEMLPVLVTMMVLMESGAIGYLDKELGKAITAGLEAAGMDSDKAEHIGAVVGDALTAIIVTAAVLLSGDLGAGFEEVDVALEEIEEGIEMVDLSAEGATNLTEETGSTTENKTEMRKKHLSTKQNISIGVFAGSSTMMSTNFAFDLINAIPALKDKHKLAASLAIIMELTFVVAAAAGGAGMMGAGGTASEASGLSSTFNVMADSVESVSETASGLLRSMGDFFETKGKKDAFKSLQYILAAANIVQGTSDMVQGTYEATVQAKLEKELGYIKANIDLLTATEDENAQAMNTQEQRWKQMSDALQTLIGQINLELPAPGDAAANAIAKNS